MFALGHVDLFLFAFSWEFGFGTYDQYQYRKKEFSKRTNKEGEKEGERVEYQKWGVDIYQLSRHRVSGCGKQKVE
jgi:hypothetical protein